MKFHNYILKLIFSNLIVCWVLAFVQPKYCNSLVFSVFAPMKLSNRYITFPRASSVLFCNSLVFLVFAPMKLSNIYITFPRASSVLFCDSLVFSVFAPMKLSQLLMSMVME